MELYGWQKECLEKWHENQTRGIVNVFTGGGKTVFALAAAEDLRNKYHDQLHIRIVVPTIALAKQWKKEIISYFPEMEFDSSRIGFYYGAHKNKSDREIMIYVINSAREVLPSHVLHDMENGIHTLLICDECHRYTGEVNRNVFRFIHSQKYSEDLYHCLGLSATPQNDNYETVLVPALGKEIYHYDIQRAHKDERISPFVLFHTAISLNGAEASDYGEATEYLSITYTRLIKEYPFLKYADSAEFNRFVFKEAREDDEGICAAFANLVLKRRDIIYNAENRKKCVLFLLSSLRPDEKVILFAERIEQADEIYSLLLPVYGNLVTHYHSEMPARLRSHNLSLFRIGEARILISCKALDEGLDVPDASIGIVMSSTSVSRQRIQRLGRILRKDQDKHLAVLYYIYASGTVEDQIYLEGLSEIDEEVELSYDGANQMFDCEQYSRCAVYMSKKLPESIGLKERQEINSCLVEGIIRSDWLLPVDVLSEKISTVNNRHEKNYWIVMKNMAAARKQLYDHTDPDVYPQSSIREIEEQSESHGYLPLNSQS